MVLQGQMELKEILELRVLKVDQVETVATEDEPEPEEQQDIATLQVLKEDAHQQEDCHQDPIYIPGLPPLQQGSQGIPQSLQDCKSIPLQPRLLLPLQARWSRREILPAPAVHP